MQEIWKDVVGYEGLYKVSSYGNIYGIKSSKIKNQRISTNGYLVTDLYIKNIGNTRTLHRLIAIAFIPNPENKPEVNHIDGNKLNNNYHNLEWCTSKENINHAVATGLIKRPRRSILAVNKSLTLTFDSVSSASNKLKISESGIYNALQGYSKSSGGYKFYYQ